MNFLEEKIISDGVIYEGNVLKVDNFLNHQLDISIISQLAEEIKSRFSGKEVTKILTIEASGIAIGTLLGYLYHVPVVYAKKAATVNSTDNKYISQAFSFTHKKTNNILVSKPYLKKGEKVIIVDDFIADGQAMGALIDIVKQAEAEVVGIGIAIEKGQQGGGDKFRAEGYPIESVAIIEAMDYQTQTITFRGKEAQKLKKASRGD